MMNLAPAVAAAEDLLREHGASEVAHPGGTLLEHLHRVRGQLSAWGGFGYRFSDEASILRWRYQEK